MKKINVNRDSVKLVVCLAVIALVSSLLLAVVNNFTKVDEEKMLREAIAENYSSPLTDESFDLASFENLEKASIEAMFRAEDGAVVILSKSTNCYNSTKGISLLVIIKGDDIVKITSYAHGETPGLGTNALKESYLERYSSFNVSDYAVEKLTVKGTEAPKYSSATRSSNGVRDAVFNAVKAYKELGGAK